MLFRSNLFAEVVNQAMPEATRDQARRAVLKLAGERTTGSRGQFLTPGDLLAAMRDLQAGDLEVQRERLRAEVAANGSFVAEGIDDPAADVAWRQAATKAFMDGATRAEAERAAWQHIGQQPPAIEPTKHHQFSTNEIGKHDG